MEFQSPFQTVSPSLDGDVLAILARAERAATAGEIASRLGKESKSGVRKVLTRLADQGLLSIDRAGSANVFRLNRDHLAAAPIIALSGLRETYLDRLRHEIQVAPIQPTFAALFGSAARCDMTAESDIDIFFVRPDNSNYEVWLDWEIELCEKSTRWTGNDTRPFTMTDSEVYDGIRKGKSVLNQIAVDGIALAGNPIWLSNAIREKGGQK